MLITRAAEDAAATAAGVEAAGFEPVLAPLLRIVPRPLALPGPVDAVVITSGHAVPALPAALHATPLFAVGDSTAERARHAGFGDVQSAHGDADDLSRLVLSRVRGRTLLATGEGQGAALSTMLRQGGLRVARRVAYAARPVARLPAPARAALDSGRLHAVLFLSATTAGCFARLLPVALHPALSTVIAATIAEPAASAIRPLPWRQVRVSLRPTLHNVLALL